MEIDHCGLCVIAVLVRLLGSSGDKIPPDRLNTTRDAAVLGFDYSRREWKTWQDFVGRGTEHGVDVNDAYSRQQQVEAEGAIVGC